MHHEGSTARAAENDECVTRDSGAQPSAEAAGGRVITSLALMPENALLDESALAAMFGVTARTVRRMVARNELPPPIRMAGHAIWIAGAVVEYVNNRAAEAARSAEGARIRLQLRGRPTV